MSTKRLEQLAQATKTAFVFPGQGSQKVGMLAELAEQFVLVQDTFREASDALGFDLWQISQSGEGLDQTENTQPVLLTASIALWRVWLELGGVVPKYVAGHSLGEYSALVAAEAMTLADAVRLVNLRNKRLSLVIPALLTNTNTAPYCCSMFDTNTSIAAPSRTSNAMPTPYSAKLADNCFAPASVVAVPTTKKPSCINCWAMAAPMPRLAPVTNATLRCCVMQFFLLPPTLR